MQCTKRGSTSSGYEHPARSTGCRIEDPQLAEQQIGHFRMAVLIRMDAAIAQQVEQFVSVFSCFAPVPVVIYQRKLFFLGELSQDVHVSRQIVSALFRRVQRINRVRRIQKQERISLLRLLEKALQPGTVER